MKILFVIFGFALLLLAGCTQKTQTEKKEDKTTMTTPPATTDLASVGDADQKVSENDLPPTSPEDDNDTKDLDKMINELG